MNRYEGKEHHVDLVAIARDVAIREGFVVDFPLEPIPDAPVDDAAGIEDQTSLL